MTSWQWRVVLALCRIVIDMKQDYLHMSSVEDLNLLHEALVIRESFTEIKK